MALDAEAFEFSLKAVEKYAKWTNPKK